MDPKQDVAGALYVFTAWLSQRAEPITIGRDNDAAPLVPLLDEFCQANGIPEPREDFHQHFVHPAPQEV